MHMFELFKFGAIKLNPYDFLSTVEHKKEIRWNDVQVVFSVQSYRMRTGALKI